MGKNQTSFKKGQIANPKGRGVGAESHLTKTMKTVKQTVLDAFNELQADPVVNIVAWGKENPTEFYRIASKLIPTEIQAKVLKIGVDLEEEVKYIDGNTEAFDEAQIIPDTDAETQ